MLRGGSLEKEDVESFGDLLGGKEENIFSMGLQNVQNMPEQRNTDKSNRLFNYIKDNDFDIFLTTEIGLDWRVVDIENQWFERVRQLKRSKSSYAFNKNENSGQSTRLPGGVAIIATDQVAHRVSATGHDESGLGR